MKNIKRRFFAHGFGILGILISVYGCEDPVTKPKPEKKWTAVSPDLSGMSLQCMAADPANPQRLYVGTIDGIYRSEDEGKTWQSKNTGLENHDIKSIVMDASRTDLVFCATWGKGIFKSVNRADDWNRITSLAAKLVDVIHFSNGRSDSMWAGCSDGIYVSRDGGQGWNYQWASGGRRVLALTSWSSPKQEILAGVLLIGFVRSDNDGLEWKTVNTGIDQSDGLLDSGVLFTIDPSAPQIVYATSAWGSVYRSVDSGNTWQSCFEDLTWQHCIGVRFGPQQDHRLYMGMLNGMIYRSDDGGASWQTMGDNLEGMTLNFFTVVPGPANTIYAGSATQGLYRYVE